MAVWEHSESVEGVIAMVYSLRRLSALFWLYCLISICIYLPDECEIRDWVCDINILSVDK